MSKNNSTLSADFSPDKAIEFDEQVNWAEQPAMLRSGARRAGKMTEQHKAIMGLARRGLHVHLVTAEGLTVCWDRLKKALPGDEEGTYSIDEQQVCPDADLGGLIHDLIPVRPRSLGSEGGRRARHHFGVGHQATKSVG